MRFKARVGDWGLGLSSSWRFDVGVGGWNVGIGVGTWVGGWGRGWAGVRLEIVVASFGLLEVGD